MTEAQQTLAILFADIAGSTQLYERVGDVEAHRRVAESLAFMARAVQSHGGQVLRTVGDSTLASFSSCDDALLAACEMQAVHKNTPLSVRAGFHFGPVIPDKGDVYGNAVNIAARVASFAKTEEITATVLAVELLSESNRARATLLDNIHIKGISEPMGVYRIAWEADQSMHTRVAPMQLKETKNDNRYLEISTAAARLKLDAKCPTLTIGRDNECSLHIDGDRISRQHAKLEWHVGQILLSDNSTNGTYVQQDGQKTLFVRRETVVLEGVGRLGMGVMAGEDATHTVSFKISDN